MCFNFIIGAIIDIKPTTKIQAIYTNKFGKPNDTKLSDDKYSQFKNCSKLVKSRPFAMFVDNKTKSADVTNEDITSNNVLIILPPTKTFDEQPSDLYTPILYVFLLIVLRLCEMIVIKAKAINTIAKSANMSEKMSIISHTLNTELKLSIGA